MCNSKLSRKSLLEFHCQDSASPHLFQRDASQYGASAQQQRQQAHQDHGHIKRQTGVILRWRWKTRGSQWSFPSLL